MYEVVGDGATRRRVAAVVVMMATMLMATTMVVALSDALVFAFTCKIHMHRIIDVSLWLLHAPRRTSMLTPLGTAAPCSCQYSKAPISRPPDPGCELPVSSCHSPDSTDK